MITLAVAAALLAAPSTPLAGAAAEQNVKDARCLLAAAMLSGSDNAEMKTAGLIASQYYLGRLDGRAPGIDLEALLKREAEKMTQAEQGPLLVTCGAALEERGKALEAVGNRMAGKGR